MSVTNSLVRVRKNPNGTYVVQYKCRFLGIHFWQDHAVYGKEDLALAIQRADDLLQERSLEAVTVYEK